MPGGPDGPIGGIGMASKLIGTVARSLHMAAAPQQALLQATGVQLNVMLYSEVVDAGHPLCSLCTLTAGKSAKESIVLIQGAEL